MRKALACGVGGVLAAAMRCMLSRNGDPWEIKEHHQYLRYGRAPKKRNGRHDTGVARQRREARKARNKKG